MKLVVFWLFAVCCGSLVNASIDNSNMLNRKLQEILRELAEVKRRLQNNEQLLYTPPEDIEDCCSLSALQCFRANLKVQFTDRRMSKLHNSLKRNLTERAMTFCNSENFTCQDCDAHPRKNARTFFNSLESLIQRGITRLSMN